MKNHNGFTLIELIIVIVVLGILAVTALPKFINIQDNAVEAAAEGIVGSINSAAVTIRGKAIVEGVATAGGNVSVGASNVAIVSGGYPAATAAGIGSSIEISDSWIGAVSGTTYVYQNESGGCTVVYAVTANALEPTFSSSVTSPCIE